MNSRLDKDFTKAIALFNASDYEGAYKIYQKALAVDGIKHLPGYVEYAQLGIFGCELALSILPYEKIAPTYESLKKQASQLSPTISISKDIGIEIKRLDGIIENLQYPANNAAYQYQYGQQLFHVIDAIEVDAEDLFEDTLDDHTKFLIKEMGLENASIDETIAALTSAQLALETASILYDQIKSKTIATSASNFAYDVAQLLADKYFDKAMLATTSFDEKIDAFYKSKNLYEQIISTYEEAAINVPLALDFSVLNVLEQLAIADQANASQHVQAIREYIDENTLHEEAGLLKDDEKEDAIDKLASHLEFCESFENANQQSNSESASNAPETNNLQPMDTSLVAPADAEMESMEVEPSPLVALSATVELNDLANLAFKMLAESNRVQEFNSTTQSKVSMRDAPPPLSPPRLQPEPINSNALATFNNRPTAILSSTQAANSNQFFNQEKEPSAALQATKNSTASVENVSQLTQANEQAKKYLLETYQRFLVILNKQNDHKVLSFLLCEIAKMHRGIRSEIALQGHFFHAELTQALYEKALVLNPHNSQGAADLSQYRKMHANDLTGEHSIANAKMRASTYRSEANQKLYHEYFLECFNKYLTQMSNHYPNQAQQVFAYFIDKLMQSHLGQNLRASTTEKLKTESLFADAKRLIHKPYQSNEQILEKSMR